MTLTGHYFITVLHCITLVHETCLKHSSFLNDCLESLDRNQSDSTHLSQPGESVCVGVLIPTAVVHVIDVRLN